MVSPSVAPTENNGVACHRSARPWAVTTGNLPELSIVKVVLEVVVSFTTQPEALTTSATAIAGIKPRTSILTPRGFF
jgi:hypothetical protein